MRRILISITSIFLLVSVIFAEEGKKETPKEKEKAKSSKEYIADLSSENEDIVIKAADWIGQNQEKSAIPKLTQLLKNGKGIKVRVFAAIALGKIGEESTIEYLNEALLNDQNANVRYSVLLAIHRIGSTKSLDALKKAKEMESDPFIKDYIKKMEEKARE